MCSRPAVSTITASKPRFRASATAPFARAIADAVDEGLDDLEIDVGLEQREPDLAQCGFDQVFREPPLPAKGPENVLQACAEGVKHWPLTCSSANAYRSGAADGVSNRGK